MSNRLKYRGSAIQLPTTDAAIPRHKEPDDKFIRVLTLAMIVGLMLMAFVTYHPLGCVCRCPL